MPIRDSFKKFVDSRFRTNHQPLKVDAELYEDIQNSVGDGKLLRVRPYPDNDGLAAGEELLQALHDLRTQWFGKKNVSETKTFEIWFNDGKIQFMFYVTDSREEQKFRKQIDAYYPNARIEEVDHVFPPIQSGDYVAGSELELKLSKYHPVRSRDGVREFISDPYKSITSDMVSSDKCRLVVQVLFKPALQSWTEGGPWGWTSPFNSTVEDYAETVRSDKLVEGFFSIEERKPTNEERQLAEYIAHQRGLPAYHINLRIIGFSPIQSEVKSNVWSVGKTFEQSFKEVGGQTFVQKPQGGPNLRDLVINTAGRNFIDHDMVLTIPEVAAVAHIPNDDIETPSVDWNNLKEGDRLPADAERFDDGYHNRSAPTQSDFETGDDEPIVKTPQIREQKPGILSRLLNLGETNYIADDIDEVGDPDSESIAPETNTRTQPQPETRDNTEQHSEPEAETTTRDSEPEQQEFVEESEQPPEQGMESAEESVNSTEQGNQPDSESDSEDNIEEIGFEDALYETITDDETDPAEQRTSNDSVEESESADEEQPTSTNDVVKNSDEVWTKPDPGDDDYNPAKDNSNYTTGYDEDEMSGDWTGGDAREMDEEGDFDNYEIPDTSTDQSEESEQDDTGTENNSDPDSTDDDGGEDVDPWGEPDDEVDL